MLDVIEQLGGDINAKNVADQNFLHVLDLSLAETFVESLVEGPLMSIIRRLQKSSFEFIQRDFLGRTCLHTLTRHAKSAMLWPFQYIMNLDMQDESSKNASDLVLFPSTSDAFDWTPDSRRSMKMGSGDISQMRGLLAPVNSNPLSPVPENDDHPPGFSSLA